MPNGFNSGNVPNAKRLQFGDYLQLERAGQVQRHPPLCFGYSGIPKRSGMP